MREIGLEQLLNGFRRIFGLEVAINFLTQLGVRPKAAAGKQMIYLDAVAALPGGHLRRDQADVADKMLRAGVMAAGEMDVERRIDLDARLAPFADRGGVALGVGSGELAAGIAGAGDQPGTNWRSLHDQPDRLDGRDGERDILLAHARYQQVLPDRQPEFAIAKILRDVGEPAHLRAGDLAKRQR